MEHCKSKLSIFLVAITLIVFLPCLGNPVFGAGEDEAAPEPLPPIEGNGVSLSLKSTLMLALKNNLDIMFESYGPLMADTDVTREESLYDTNFTTEFRKSRSKTQVGNVLMGGAAQTTVYQENFDFNIALQKRFTPGTTAELKLTHNEVQSDLSFLGLVPQYKGELVLSLTQPLLKDFGIDIGKSQIKIANLNVEMSEHQFRKRAMDILYEVESSYWILYYSIELLKSQEKSLKAAEDLLREQKIRIEAGTLAPIEVYQAEAEVAMRKEDVIVSRDRVKDAEDRLKEALNLYDREPYWDIFIVPLDNPNTEKFHPDLNECLRVALEKRPDLNQAKLDLKASNIQIKYTKNQTLPRIDLIGSLGTSGLAGRPRDVSGAFGGRGRFGRSSSAPNPYSGHWDDVYDGLGNSDFYSYMVGIRLEFPFENRLAKSQYSLAKIQKARAVTLLKSSENAIINEVREAVRQIETDLQRIDAASASFRLATERLKAEEKKYKVGMSTTHDVLEFQDELAQAESNLVRVQAEYSRSLTNLSRVKGVLFEEKGLTM